MKKETLPGIQVFQIDANVDFRGELFTTFKGSLNGFRFDHDKIAVRYRDVLVGIHGDHKTWKLITCLHGRVYAVFVDCRPKSPEYMNWSSLVLSNENRKQVLLPPGLGNSFFVLSDFCIYNYKLSYEGEYVDHDEQFTLRWDDPTLGIHWPHRNPILSERDS